MLLACLMACQEPGADCHAGPLSPWHARLPPASRSRVLACRGQPIAPTPPLPLVDGQTGAEWGALTGP